jgi:hypothetical protein
VAILIGIALLVGLLALIVWDRRRLERMKAEPLSREAMERGWKPSPNVKGSAYAGVALIGAVAGVSELMHPTMPPFTGRWSFVYSAAYALGPYGVAFYWFAFALGFTVAAVFAWRASRKRAF